MSSAALLMCAVVPQSANRAAFEGTVTCVDLNCHTVTLRNYHFGTIIVSKSIIRKAAQGKQRLLLQGCPVTVKRSLHWSNSPSESPRQSLHGCCQTLTIHACNILRHKVRSQVLLSKPTLSRRRRKHHAVARGCSSHCTAGGPLNFEPWHKASYKAWSEHPLLNGSSSTPVHTIHVLCRSCLAHSDLCRGAVTSRTRLYTLSRVSQPAQL